MFLNRLLYSFNFQALLHGQGSCNLKKHHELELLLISNCNLLMVHDAFVLRENFLGEMKIILIFILHYFAFWCNGFSLHERKKLIEFSCQREFQFLMGEEEMLDSSPSWTQKHLLLLLLCKQILRARLLNMKRWSLSFYFHMKGSQWAGLLLGFHIFSRPQSGVRPTFMGRT